MKSSTIVFDAITVKRENTFAFDVWYANHYLRAALAGGPFLGVRRYGSPIRGNYLALFEVTPGAASTDAAGCLDAGHELIESVERYCADAIGEQRSAGVGDEILEAAIAYPVFFRVPADRETEFNAWYEEEHLGLLLRCPYWPMCRRFKIHKPVRGSWTHIALHYLSDLRALESKERDAARATPWRDRLAANDWFKGDYRVLYKFGARQN